MAEGSTDPIVIASDDESDNDDVVLIKVEIEVDSEDVIFLSETKAPPPSDLNSSPQPIDTSVTTSETRNALSRNISLTTCTGGLSLDDSNDTDILDNLLQNSAVMTGPLDLSSKSSESSDKNSASLSPGNVDSGQNSLQRSGSDSSFMMLLTGPDPTLQTAVTLDTKSNSTGYEISDTKGAVSNVSDSNNLASVGCLSNSDICSSDQSNTGLPTLLCDKSVSHSNHSTVTDSGWSAFNLSPSIQATSANQQSNSNSTTDPYSSAADVGCIVNTKDGNSSVIVSTVVGQCVSSNQTGQQAKDDNSNNQSTISSTQVSAGQTCLDAKSNTSDSGTNCSNKDANNQRSATQKHSFDVADPFQASHALLASLDMTFDTGSQSQTGAVKTTSLTQQKTDTQSTCQTGSVILTGQSTNFTSGLLGGSVQCIQQQPVCQQVVTINSNDSSTSNIFKRSLSMTDTNPPYYNSLTLPLSQNTKSYQRSVSYNSFGAFRSGSSSKCSGHEVITQSPRSPSPPNSHHLPPKKQKRCYSDAARESKCTNCEVSLAGQKSSRCPNGHSSCTKCLEERVKLVLTGRAKESVKCLSKSCDSYYPISELRHSLPAMVVEILEDKLDQDYVDYISNMIMKDALEEIDQDSASTDLDQADGNNEMRYMKKYEDCPSNWDPMDERDVKRDGYVLVPLETESEEYQNVQKRFFYSMVDQNVEITAVHRVQNPIQWKYYTVKMSEMIQDAGGFSSVAERSLFHGTSLSAVEAICRKGFDWRLCGKHGTLYGQGSYFAWNASYSHQYTDLRRRHGSLASSMTFSQPSSMTLPTAPPLLFPPVNINFGQPLHPIGNPSGISVIQTSQYRPMNLSHNATGTGSQSVVRSLSQTGSQTQPNFFMNNNTSQFVSSNNGSLTNSAQPSPSGSGVTVNSSHNMQNILNLPSKPSNDISLKRKLMTARRKQFPIYSRKIPKSFANVIIQGLGSSGMGSAFEQEEIERPTARMFLARVLVGQYTTGNAKLRKPPPLYHNSDQFGKCYDSCVDNVDDPKIFVVFDSSQAYPEYLVEYANTEDKMF